MNARTFALSLGVGLAGAIGCQEADAPPRGVGVDAQATGDDVGAPEGADANGTQLGTQVGGLAECPARIEGAQGRVTVAGDALHLTFTAAEGQEDALRRSATLLGEMLQGEVELVEGEAPSVGETIGDTTALEPEQRRGTPAGAEPTRTRRAVQVWPEQRMGWAETPLVMPPSTVTTEAVDGGVRLVIEPRNPQHLSLIQTQLNQWLVTSRDRACPPIRVSETLPGAQPSLERPELDELGRPPGVQPPGAQSPGLEAPGPQPGGMAPPESPAGDDPAGE